jgi:SAM-dependent methyltransferase
MRAFDQKLVLRANELFHDAEGIAYDNAHPEIFITERDRWYRAFQSFLPKYHQKYCIDIGAGTGFVGEVLLPFLSENESLLCADISDEMLTIAKRRLGSLSHGVHVRTLKMNDEYIALPDASVDVVTLNSVLHHIPSSSLLLSEVFRVLKPEGILFIGHEPNNLFHKQKLLRLQETIFHHCTPKRIAALMLKTLHVYHLFVPKEELKQDMILQHVNVHLLREQFITEPLSRSALSAIVDIHSPSAGGVWLERGFDPQHLLDPWAERCEILSVETYNFFPKIKKLPHFISAYNRLLHILFPSHGSTFFIIAWRKER